MNNLKNLKNHYNKKGWVVYKNLFSFDEINLINSIIDDFIKEKIKSNNKQNRSINFVGNKRSIENLNSFHELSQSKKVKNFAKKKNVLDIAKEFLNSEPEFRCCELFAKPALVGLQSPDHQDNYYWAVKGANALTLWISLGNSNKNNGCVYYYDGSHNYGILQHQASFAKGSSQKISNTNFLKKFKISYPKLQPGDALIHHSLVVHGSSKNISKNSRRGWTIQFKDINASYDLEQTKIYEKSLNNQIQTRSKFN